MRDYDTIIFDLDGTLLDTLDDLRDSLNRTLRHFDRREHSLDEVRGFVGNGVATLVARALDKGREDKRFDEILAAFSEDYGRNSACRTKPYNGVERLLTQLGESGVKLAIVSNKTDSAVKALNRHYFGELVSVAIGESAGTARKPAPDTVLKALKELGSAKERAVFIGDSEVDIETAKNAGIRCISVSWGFRDEAFLREHGAVNIVGSVTELEALLK